MAARNEDVIHEDFYKGIHNDENNVWLQHALMCGGLHLFAISATCLVLR